MTLPSSSRMPTIECIDLSKSYGRGVTALNTVNLTIEPQTSFGLLGENGAGKSTLVKILLGFIYPTSGRVRVLGEEQVVRAHRRIGYVHERPIFETRFTGRAYLHYLGQLSGMWDAQNETRVDALLEQVNLRDAANRPTGTYSKGMLQRLAIAQALLTDPELLILDEPTSGLDPRSQWEVRQILSELRTQGKTLLICSHYLTEIEAVCDAVGILRRGQLILSGTVADLLQSQGIVEIVLGSEQAAQDIVARLALTDAVIEVQGNRVWIAETAQARVLATLIRAEIPVVSLNPVSHTLEEVYVQTTQAVDSGTMVRS